MIGNYPEGAQHDKKAPWNNAHEYCPYCHTIELAEMARDEARSKANEANKTIANPDEHMSEEDFYDECYQKAMDDSRLCTQCYLEEHEDDWREDI
jgi:RNA polymerase subunit RPABC4/transcription elongation factor Spt4